MHYCIIWIVSPRHTCPIEINRKGGLTFEMGAHFWEGAYFQDYTVFEQNNHCNAAKCTLHIKFSEIKLGN